MARMQRLEDAEIHRESVPRARLSPRTPPTPRGLSAPGLAASLDAPDLPDTLNIDAEIVMQVLENILSNASRYAKSRVELSLSANGESFTAAVRDDGPGFSAEALAKAANPFYKGRESTGEHLGLWPQHLRHPHPPPRRQPHALEPPRRRRGRDRPLRYVKKPAERPGFALLDRVIQYRLQ